MRKLMLIILSLAFATTSAEAQFLKNLKKKVEEKVERRVTEKVSEKAADKADKTLEEMWTPSIDKSMISMAMGADRVPSEEIPAAYKFHWEYTLTLQSSQGETDMVYLIPENTGYSGMKLSQANGMLIVHDTRKDMTVMYMDSQGNRMVTATKNPEVEEMESEEMIDYEDMEMQKTDTKTILGYHCQGYEMENEDYLMTFYVTNEAEFSFNQLSYSKDQKLPDEFNSEWLEEGSLMMQMEMQHKNKDEGITMTCTKIEKKPFIIRTSEYQTF